MTVVGPDQVGTGKSEHNCARPSDLGLGGDPRSVFLPVSGARKNGRGMRPVGGDRRSPPKVRDGQSDVSDRMMVASDGPVVWGNNRVVPLSVEAEEFP